MAEDRDAPLPAGVFLFHSQDPKVQLGRILSHLCDEVLNIDRDYPRVTFSPPAQRTKVQSDARNQLREFFSTPTRDKIVVFVGHGARLGDRNNGSDSKFAFLFNPEDQEDRLTLDDLYELALGTPTRRVFPFIFSCTPTKEELIPLRYLEWSRSAMQQEPRFYLRLLQEPQQQRRRGVPSSPFPTFHSNSQLMAHMEHVFKTLERWQNRHWKAHWHLEPQHINFADPFGEESVQMDLEDEEDEALHQLSHYLLLSPSDIRTLAF